MNIPSFFTRVIGHPIVAAAAMVVTVLLIYRWTQNTQLWLPALGAIFLLNRVMTANEQVTYYKAWRRAWDGMGGNGSASSTRWRMWLGAVVLGISAPSLFIARFERPAMPIIVGIVLGLALMLVAVLLAAHRARRGSTRPDGVHTVAICVASPLMPVPTLIQTYEALPAHCWQVLSKV